MASGGFCETPVCGPKAIRGGKGPPSVKQASRCADVPGQALNADICFVPEQHTPGEKLPAVSGSSGRLLVQRSVSDKAERQWPGQVFAQTELDFETAMQEYISSTLDRQLHSKTERSLDVAAPSAYRQRQAAQAERYRARVRRKREDAEWKVARAKHRQARRDWQALSTEERRQHLADWVAEDQAWKARFCQRRIAVVERERENQVWHAHNKALRGEQKEDTRRWIAILVVTDNCTRKCYGLPLFRAGPKLTAQDLVDALRKLLPSELAYFISDQGAHFRTNAFAKLAQDVGFVHVPVYRHRPQTNGIAERFVRTLKEWLATKTWSGADALEPLLPAFVSEYNDRPHQGLPIPGLSPNEFEQRIWLL